MKHFKKFILAVAMLIATVSTIFAFNINGKKTLWTGKYQSSRDLPVGIVHGWIKVALNDNVNLVYGDVNWDVHFADYIGNLKTGLKIPVDLDLYCQIVNNSEYAPVLFQVEKGNVVTKIYCDDEEYTEYDEELCHLFGYHYTGAIIMQMDNAL